MSEIPEYELKRVASEFKSLKIRQIVLAIPLVCAGLSARYLIDNPENIPDFLQGYNLGYILFGVIILAVILSFLNWRCPKCNSYLGKNINPAFCGSCGIKLRN